MNPVRRKTLYGLAALVLSGWMCSSPLSVEKEPAPTPPPGVEATIASLQATLDAFQSRPSETPASPTASITLPSDTPPPGGSLSGTLTYPADHLPPLRIVAFNLKTGEWSSIEIREKSTFVIENLPAGIYHVVAYPIGVGSPGLAGGYSKAVPCGVSVDCTDHGLIDVEVTTGATASGIDPGDWYAPAGSFPKDPTRN